MVGEMHKIRNSPCGIEGYMFKELRKGRPIKTSSEVKRKDMMGFRVTRNID